jgi:hypothetical protein
MPQHIHIVDAVRPADHPGDQAGHLQLGVHPASAADPDVLFHQATQAGPLGQGHHRHQARPRHEIPVIKRRVDLRQPVQQSHLTGAPSNQGMEVFSNSHRPWSRGTFRVNAPHSATIHTVDPG